MPRNPRQLEWQATVVKKLIGHAQISPSRRFDEAFNQIIKACESTMNDAAIMKKQYQDLFAAHEKEKQKRRKSKKKINHEGGITREEAQELMKSRDEAIQPSINEAAQSTLQPRKRVPKCSNCGTVSHNIRKCPNLTIN